MPTDPSQKRATIHDVARRAGVSAATVSKVIRGVKSVREDNAQRVRKAVAELDYRMDPIASGLRGEQRRIIGALVPDLETPFFGRLVTALERVAEEAGYHMIVASSRESEAREADLVRRMNDWRVAGTILCPVRSERGMGAAALRENKMQAVLVDRVSADATFDTVASANAEASAEVAEYLIGLGHRHVLLHGATRLWKAIRTRAQGFEDHARARVPNIQVDRLIADIPRDEQRLAIRAYFETLDETSRPTAVFSLSQHSTLLVLSELRRMGLDVPGDIALVGFDDVEWMQTTWPTITTVAQPVQALAERALSVLLQRVEGEMTGPPVAYLEPCTRHARESAGAV